MSDVGANGRRGVLAAGEEQDSESVADGARVYRVPVPDPDPGSEGDPVVDPGPILRWDPPPAPAVVVDRRHLHASPRRHPAASLRRRR